jgi:putative acetyltransferase
MRDGEGQVVGFIGVDHDKVEMLFVHAIWRGQRIRRRLMTYAVMNLGASMVDANER